MCSYKLLRKLSLPCLVHVINLSFVTGTTFQKILHVSVTEFSGFRFISKSSHYLSIYKSSGTFWWVLLNKIPNLSDICF